MANIEALAITNQYRQSIRTWETMLKLGENICLIFPYLSDRQSRIHQWQEDLDRKAFYPIEIDFSINHFDELGEFEAYIISKLPDTWKKADLNSSLKKTDKQIVLIITNGESLTNPHNYKALSVLQKILTSHAGKLLSLVTFESNVYLNIPSMYSYNKLFQNIIYYPLYEGADINLFIQYLCVKWQMKMPSPIRKSIMSASGGSFWLTKEACRNYRDSGKWNTDSEGFYDRLILLSKTFSEKEIDILISLPFVRSYEQSDEYKYLKNTGFITQKNQSRNPLLLAILQSKKQPKNLLELKDNEILFKGVSINQILSPTEFSVLKLFLSEPNTEISRDKIASRIWPTSTEEHYSSWAIDQAVKRLRDRLVSLNLPPTIISSVRGVGYEYRG